MKIETFIQVGIFFGLFIFRIKENKNVMKKSMFEESQVCKTIKEVWEFIKCYVQKENKQ